MDRGLESQGAKSAGGTEKEWLNQWVLECRLSGEGSEMCVATKDKSNHLAAEPSLLFTEINKSTQYVFLKCVSENTNNTFFTPQGAYSLAGETRLMYKSMHVTHTENTAIFQKCQVFVF